MRPASASTCSPENLGLRSTGERMDTSASATELALAPWNLVDAPTTKEMAPPPPKYRLTLSCHLCSPWHWLFPAPSRPASSSVTPDITANAMCFISTDSVVFTTVEVSVHAIPARFGDDRDVNGVRCRLS
ncbi:hypothetical protein HPB50_027606 [Hyalomma asiaticum]|nr:hypothetical protein HPB50_027606 [Hyalomma asiaticum]